MKELKKELRIIKKKLGFDAFELILDWVFKVSRRMEELEDSRDKWRKKYEDLKNEN